MILDGSGLPLEHSEQHRLGALIQIVGLEKYVPCSASAGHRHPPANVIAAKCGDVTRIVDERVSLEGR